MVNIRVNSGAITLLHILELAALVLQTDISPDSVP
jgi:hypothetical protein